MTRTPWVPCRRLCSTKRFYFSLSVSLLQHRPSSAPTKIRAGAKYGQATQVGDRTKDVPNRFLQPTGKVSWRGLRSSDNYFSNRSEVARGQIFSVPFTACRWLASSSGTLTGNSLGFFP